MKRQELIITVLVAVCVVCTGIETRGDVMNLDGPIAVQVGDPASLADLNLTATGDVYWFVGEQGELIGENFEFICHGDFLCEPNMTCDSMTIITTFGDVLFEGLVLPGTGGGDDTIDVTIDPPDNGGGGGDVTITTTSGDVDYYGGGDVALSAAGSGVDYYGAGGLTVSGCTTTMNAGGFDVDFSDVSVGEFSGTIICASSCQMPEVVDGINLDPWPHGLVGLAVVDGTEAIVVDGDVLLWIDQEIGDVYIEADGMIQVLNGDVPIGLFTVPEPGSMVLLLGGVLGLMKSRRQTRVI